MPDELKPITMGEYFNIPEEKISTFQKSISDDLCRSLNYMTNLPGEQLESKIEESIKAIEASRENMVHRQAEANAEAYAKAMRTAPCLFDEIVGALSSLCGNIAYNSSSPEDMMNDYVRDILGRGLQVRDQTRQGISGNSRSAERGKAGELDIQIRNNGRPIGIFEGLRLESVNSQYIYDHIRKATINYNPQGVKEIFIVAYVQRQTKEFGGFWKRFVDCVKKYSPSDVEYEIMWDEDEEDTGLSSVRSIHGIYCLDDVDHNVHVMAVKMMV